MRKEVLDEVRSTHKGSSKVKMLARQYFWYPKLDSDLENLTKSCDICRKNANNSNKAVLIKFEEAKKPLERVHIDFCGPFHGISWKHFFSFH